MSMAVLGWRKLAVCDFLLAASVSSRPGSLSPARCSSSSPELQGPAQLPPKWEGRLDAGMVAAAIYIHV